MGDFKMKTTRKFKINKQTFVGIMTKEQEKIFKKILKGGLTK